MEGERKRLKHVILIADGLHFARLLSKSSVHNAHAWILRRAFPYGALVRHAFISSPLGLKRICLTKQASRKCCTIHFIYLFLNCQYNTAVFPVPQIYGFYAKKKSLPARLNTGLSHSKLTHGGLKPFCATEVILILIIHPWMESTHSCFHLPHGFFPSTLLKTWNLILWGFLTIFSAAGPPVQNIFF